MSVYRERPKSEAELTEYQKEIEATENVILCVAKAEKMIRSIGASLCPECSGPIEENSHPTILEDAE